MRRDHRGIAAVGGTVALAGLLVVLGVCVARQVGSARPTLARVEVRRTVDRIAEDAFEEACARLEATPPTANGGGPVRMEVALTEAAADAGKAGLRVGPVRVSTSPLLGSGTRYTGIVELSVPVSLEGQRAARTITVRRQFQVVLVQNKFALNISDRNLCREVREP